MKKIIIIVTALVLITGIVFFINNNKIKEKINNKTKQTDSVVEQKKEKTLEEKKEEIKDFFTEEELKNIKNVKDIVLNNESYKLIEQKDTNNVSITNRNLIILDRNGDKKNIGKFGQIQNTFDSLIFSYKTNVNNDYLVILEWEKPINKNVENLTSYELGVYDFNKGKYTDILIGEDGVNWNGELYTFPYKTKPQIIKYLKSIEKDGELKSQIQ